IMMMRVTVMVTIVTMLTTAMNHTLHRMTKVTTILPIMMMRVTVMAIIVTMLTTAMNHMLLLMEMKHMAMTATEVVMVTVEWIPPIEVSNQGTPCLDFWSLEHF
ncbi:MAG: hypothetical protein AAFY91_18455, partial [Bacteroidota bacterium]